MHSYAASPALTGWRLTAVPAGDGGFVDGGGAEVEREDAVGADLDIGEPQAVLERQSLRHHHLKCVYVLGGVASAGDDRKGEFFAGGGRL